ncbi:hypothetical protein KUL25_00260 [Rhodobacteraceae bacterium N5(2021)]|uniref:Uncharacterized protein n=1 Tax=Gymnodinialimonas phycosphaerae TaxID=2841589 RepID=A0A975YG29_9RHOB|nr:hypothetical protein [Gymnodinialimonas phycosphaerae]MBY4891192.1 hypothetical protein [Gymnodinialimonas phycosphaerae]
MKKDDRELGLHLRQGTGASRQRARGDSPLKLPFRARMQRHNRSLDLVEESLADTSLRAPFDGIVNGVEVQGLGDTPVCGAFDTQCTQRRDHGVLARLRTTEATSISDPLR